MALLYLRFYLGSLLLLFGFYLSGHYLLGLPFPTPRTLFHIALGAGLGVGLGVLYHRLWPLPPLGLGRVVRLFILLPPASCWESASCSSSRPRWPSTSSSPSWPGSPPPMDPRTVPPLSALPEEAREALLREAWEEVHPAGARLLEQGGAVASALYLVLEGQMALLDGEEEVGTLEAGAFFGFPSLLSREPPAFSVVARTPVRLLVFPEGPSGNSSFSPRPPASSARAWRTGCGSGRPPTFPSSARWAGWSGARPSSSHPRPASRRRP